MENIFAFETIFDTSVVEPMMISSNLPEETYCPDCYDCDYNCTDAN